jgi:hypothetical protein
MRVLSILGVLVMLSGLSGVTVDTAGPKFRTDDPLAREPESQDAGGAQETEIGLVYNLSYDLFVTASRDPEGIRAQNVNTIDEVPDSSWFTNRIGTHPLTAAQIIEQSTPGAPPASEAWTVIREKSAGFAPGFTARDAKGETWFISFDPPSNPEGATGAMVIASKIFWALGYNQVETFITTIDRRALRIDPEASVRRPSGKRIRARITSGRWPLSCGGRTPLARPGHRRVQIRRHAIRRSKRSGASRASPRTARAARLWRVDEPHRHESRQHARHRREARWPLRHHPLPAGRGIHLRDGRQRTPRLG